MVSMLRRNWWLLALRGALAIIFGVIALFWPELALGALVILFGAYAFTDGLFAIAAALIGGIKVDGAPTGVSGVPGVGARRPWWALLIEGILGIMTGIITFLWPGITALVLLAFIAAWAIITGIFEIAAAIQLRRVIENELLLGIGGVLSVLFGLLLILFPGAGALSVIWLIGSYAIIFGFAIMALGFRMRGVAGR